MRMRSLLMLGLVGSTLGAGVADAAYFEANLASSLGTHITLDDGDTWDLDFIEFTANGTTGLSP